jgi:carbon storage regulator
MLVLSRKADQRIAIGDDVWVTVLKVVGNRVQIGIDAPTSKPILRGELVAQRPLARIAQASHAS